MYRLLGSISTAPSAVPVLGTDDWCSILQQEDVLAAASGGRPPHPGHGPAATGICCCTSAMLSRGTARTCRTVWLVEEWVKETADGCRNFAYPAQTVLLSYLRCSKKQEQPATRQTNLQGLWLMNYVV